MPVMHRRMGALGGDAWSFGFDFGGGTPAPVPDAPVQAASPELLGFSQMGMSRAAAAVMRPLNSRALLQIQGSAGHAVGLGPAPTGNVGGHAAQDRATWTAGAGGGPPVAAIAAGVLGLGVLAFFALKMLGQR
jgi:hypothetical protein